MTPLKTNLKKKKKKTFFGEKNWKKCFQLFPKTFGQKKKKLSKNRKSGSVAELLTLPDSAED